jgi:hypothetical protein
MATQHSFNDRSNGIFADHYQDKNGVPVGDTFAYLLRARLYGVAGRDWPKEKLADFLRHYTSDQLAAINTVPRVEEKEWAHLGDHWVYRATDDVEVRVCQVAEQGYQAAILQGGMPIEYSAVYPHLQVAQALGVQACSEQLRSAPESPETMQAR